MAAVCLLGPRDAAGGPRPRWGASLPRLYPGLRSAPAARLPWLGAPWRVLGHRTDCGDRGGKRHGGIGLGVEPVCHAMGLALDLI